MVRKLKALIIVNMILDYLKKTVNNLFTITNIQGVLWKKSSETSKQNLWKILKKKSQALKLNCYTRVFAESLSNLIHDFWEDCFHKPKSY